MVFTKPITGDTLLPLSRRGDMIEDFIRVLARVQSDYGFYIGCQTNPAVALRDYALNTDEYEALLDPQKLRAMLDDSALENKPKKLVITFSGRHDWVNRTKPKTKPIQSGTSTDAAEHHAQVSHEIEEIRQAHTHEERAAAAVRLLTVIE
jgi:hypothetical protein